MATAPSGPSNARDPKTLTEMKKLCTALSTMKETPLWGPAIISHKTTLTTALAKKIADYRGQYREQRDGFCSTFQISAGELIHQAREMLQTLTHLQKILGKSLPQIANDRLATKRQKAAIRRAKKIMGTPGTSGTS